jgi:hypothetical protein
MRTLKHRCEPSAARDGLLRFAQPMATLRSPSPQRPSGSTSWIFWEHSDEMTGNILARQWHPRLGTSTDEAIRILILIVALEFRDLDASIHQLYCLAEITSDVTTGVHEDQDEMAHFAIDHLCKMIRDLRAKYRADLHAGKAVAL